MKHLLELVFVILTLVSSPVFAEGVWNCVLEKNGSIQITESGNVASLKISRDIRTARGTIPSGTYLANAGEFVYVSVIKQWSLDVSRYLPDYDEGYHRYRGATLSIQVEKENPKQGFLFIEQTDADIDLSGITHLSEGINCR